MAVLFALGASAFWGLSDFLGGFASRRRPVVRVLLAGQAVGLLALVLVLWGGLVLGSLRLSSPGPASEAVVAAVAGLMWMAGLACFYQGCAIGDMGVVAPVAACGVTIPVIVGFVQGDRLLAVQVVGIVAAAAGAALCCASSPGRGPSGVLRSGRAAVFGAGAALCFGVELSLLNSVGQGGGSAALLVVRGAALVSLLLVTGSRHVVGRHADRIAAVAIGVPTPEPIGRVPHGLVEPAGGSRWRLAFLMCGAGVADVGAMAMFMSAGSRGSLPVVAVLASLYPAVTVGLGVLIGGDRAPWPQRAGLTAVLLGASLLAAT